MAIIITSVRDFLLVLAGLDLCFTNLHYRICRHLKVTMNIDMFLMSQCKWFKESDLFHAHARLQWDWLNQLSKYLLCI